MSRKDEQHTCYECHKKVMFETERDADLFNSSGMCQECRDIVFREMYDTEVLAAVQGVQEELDKAMLLLNEATTLLRTLTGKEN